MLKKIFFKFNFLINLFFLIKLKYFLYKRKFFFLKKNNFIKKIILCMDCHENNNNYNLYPEFFKIPIIKNQNLDYFTDCINNYKNFSRKSLYMNFIVSNLNNIDIWKLSRFFCFKNEKYKR